MYRTYLSYARREIPSVKPNSNHPRGSGCANLRGDDPVVHARTLARMPGRSVWSIPGRDMYLLGESA